MRALGIDPGTIVTGYGVVEEEDSRLFYVESGTISVPQRMPLSKRLQTMNGRIGEIMDRCKPQAVALESSFYAKNVQTTIRLGQVSGVILLAAENAGLPIFEYTPLAVKLSAVGYGAARKEQVYQMICHLLKLRQEPDSHHASDALAVAICHLHSYRIKELTGRT
ncbi:MAG: crossover junction endodeoxyribonuclease RuvC [Nitrospirae bacterium]|nr:crossover junction endodeoxyribonuclease RuvC [Nitrospirota bacterium]